MQKERLVHVTGNRKWTPVTHEVIRDVEMDFQMVSYNPIRRNPAVLSETLLQALPVLLQDPNVDTRRLIEEMIQGLGLPQNIIMTEKDVAEKVAIETAAAQQQALGGAAAPAGGGGGGGPLMGAEGDIPPDMLAAMMGSEAPVATPEESLAAGGGAPIREGTPEAK